MFKAQPAVVLLTIFAAIGLSGCEVIGDILQFGIWVGIILVLLVVGIIYWLFKKFSGRS